MIRGTTPTHIFTVPFDTSIINKIKVLYSQNGTILVVKTEEDCTASKNQIKVTLTQKDTFAFDAKKPAEVQLRILTIDNKSIASVPKRFGVTRNPDNEVMI